MEELAATREELQRCIRERDVDGAAAVLHPQFALLVSNPAPAVLPREQWLALLPFYEVEDYTVEAERNDLVGGFALVWQRVRLSADVRGQRRQGDLVLSDVWLREDDGWRLWRRHSTPLTGRHPFPLE